MFWGGGESFCDFCCPWSLFIAVAEILRQTSSLAPIPEKPNVFGFLTGKGVGPHVGVGLCGMLGAGSRGTVWCWSRFPTCFLWGYRARRGRGAVAVTLFLFVSPLFCCTDSVLRLMLL